MGGTFIIMQDMKGDRVYIRHQLTTEASKGDNYAELSITRNVDDISYKFADAFATYSGRYNITPELLVLFRTIAERVLFSLETSDSIYGPQLIGTETEILYIRQHQINKTHVDIGMRLGVPYPCNNIDLELTV